MELTRTNNHPQLDPMTVAKVFKESGMFPDIQSEAAACAKIIIGRGLGLTDFDAMSGLHIIKGKAVLAANLMAAAIKRAGKYDYRAQCTDTSCSITFFGRNHKNEWDEIGDAEFTLEDAKRAQLSGDNWRKYPKAMLFARCISAGYKQHCPDALGAAPVYVEAHGESEITEDAPVAAPVQSLIESCPPPKRRKAAAAPEIVVEATVIEDAPVPAPAAKKVADQIPWARAGTDVLTPRKCVARGAMQTAVLFEDLSGVKNWVSVGNDLISTVKIDHQCEVDYAWTAGGYYAASRISVYGGGA